MAKSEEPDGRVIDKKSGSLPNRGSDKNPNGPRKLEDHQLHPTHKIDTWDWQK